MPRLKGLTTRRFLTELVAELLGTLFLTFMACGSSLTWPQQSPPTIIHMAFTSGLTVASGIMIVGHVSGGLFNPAVTLALCTAGKLSPFRSIGYVLAEVAGAIIGAAIVYGLTPSEVRGTLGVTVPADNVSLGQAIGMELMLTFFLIMTIFGATDEKRNLQGYQVALSIGVAVFICLMTGMPYTGASLNPARSFGPALITNSWKNHWVYWAAPISGGLLATFLYESIFSLKRLEGSINEDNTYEFDGMAMNSIDNQQLKQSATMSNVTN